MKSSDLVCKTDQNDIHHVILLLFPLSIPHREWAICKDLLNTLGIHLVLIGYSLGINYFCVMFEVFTIEKSNTAVITVFSSRVELFQR